METVQAVATQGGILGKVASPAISNPGRNGPGTNRVRSTEFDLPFEIMVPCILQPQLYHSREAAIAILKTKEWKEALKNECYEYIPRKKRTTPFRQMIERMPGKTDSNTFGWLQSCLDEKKLQFPV